MKNELLQLGLPLNVICLKQLKLTVILKGKSTTVGFETGTQNLNQCRVPTVMEKHGKHLVMESHGKWAKKIKSWKFKRSWKSHGISPLLIANHA